MGFSGSSILALISFLFSVSLATSVSDNFLECLSQYSHSSNPVSSVIYTPNNSSYISILQSTIQNLRFLSFTEPIPRFIITPTHESHIQAAVLCSGKHGLQIRVRSGGHDYEGLSYLSSVPFIIVDRFNLRSINIDVEDKTAWVQSGATIGEAYYRIAERSSTHGFPAGIYPTTGVGGLLSGGGIGTMMRKYGLGSYNVLDAFLVDVNGRILNRKSMGEDLFWAIRGGGGASFGVIVSWKIRLVPVPPTVTVFRVRKTLEEGATKLVHRWQFIALKFHENLFMRAIVQVSRVEENGEKTIEALFDSLFLGSTRELFPLMEKSFPELGLKAEDCIEMSWIESVLYSANFPTGESVDVLLNRTQESKNFFKAKSDFVNESIPQNALEGMWDLLLDEEGMSEVSEPETPFLHRVIVMDPLGGIMSKISETPFSHRAGNLHNIQYLVQWYKGGSRESKKHIGWMKRLCRFMSPYASKCPRAAYLNSRDLDLGSNEEDHTGYSKASVWGHKYFENNFKRLALVKGMVDPGNFFRDEQSIPPLLRSTRPLNLWSNE